MFLRRVRVSVRVRGIGLGLGIGFREWVPIRNVIGGAAGAHIPMTLGLHLSACMCSTAPAAPPMRLPIPNHNPNQRCADARR